MKPVRVNLKKCRIIFFDLEFYVPEKGRTKKGFCYNPWDKSCKFLGGSFFVTSPDKDFSDSLNSVRKNVKSMWLWNHKSEKELLEKIYQLLKSSSDLVKNSHNGQVSAVLCGIGITSSDIPILFDLFKRFKILSNGDAFYFQNQFRILDISQLSIAVFNSKNGFPYPKSKNVILNKYIPDKVFEDGRNVWSMYDSKSFSDIELRVVDEIVCTYTCYFKILSDFRKFKTLEENDKEQKKLLSKQMYEESLEG